jgi:hypothetical protein
MYRYEITNEMTFFSQKGRKYRQITLCTKRKYREKNEDLPSTGEA